METRIFTGFMKHPSDFSELDAAISRGEIDPFRIVAILGKTEGNGGRNDFSRDLAVEKSRQVLATHLQQDPAVIEDRVLLSFSGGTEGVTTPHYRVFETRGTFPSAPLYESRLAFGRGRTRQFLPEEVGTMTMVEETAQTIRRILEQARIDPHDVHFVHVKGAIPYEWPPKSPRNSMAYSRGASALGVALALGEVNQHDLNDDMILQDYALYSRCASTSSKPGLSYSDIMVLGNSPWWNGNLVITHTVMQDILDAQSVISLFESFGISSSQLYKEAIAQRIHGVFAKAEADPRQSVRGYRHTMLSDDDIDDTRYARCVVSSILAAITGTPAVYVSTRAEHHGPLGGGPVAVILSIS
ncbi:ring-opening amidohydrolase [Sulfobacillus thermosulfidooxidans]|uniref:ring-opening amidohydrolase n=1 Tax=Sulfobacillus thermosulfidooxidans TaxID=28034 RepID=UPI00096BBF7A|nr:ring-opening amidohydrolase [Sulfobacillus thermosulfidooxidans]OLZ08571.1 barbiturase [Sulfobacillus thermosulfidooxidans]OLZ13173.1 barbiturase [Sulfobacillus thermosulfidooxidans]OLZ21553.1 barbiturase [Sulfobacillus thermosulfidooxidans]